MKKILFFLLATGLAIPAFSQNFEGKIVYQNNYKSKLPAVTDAQFAGMMGSTQEYFIKEGSYKSVTNGSMILWQLYVNRDNKLYTKTASSETLLWNDGAENKDEVLQAVINKNAAVLLGYQCDELILTCKSGVQKYYFSTKLAVNAANYANHAYGNWYEVVKRAGGLALKSIIDTPQFTLETIAMEVKTMPLEDSFFELPAGVQTMKSPF